MSAAAAGRLLIKFNQDHLVNRFSAGDKKISLTLIQMKTHSSIFPPTSPLHLFHSIASSGLHRCTLQICLNVHLLLPPKHKTSWELFASTYSKIKSHYVNGKIRKFSINKCWKYSKKKIIKFACLVGNSIPELHSFHHMCCSSVTETCTRNWSWCQPKPEGA